MATIKVYRKTPNIVISSTGRNCDYFTLRIQEWDVTGEKAVMEVQAFDWKSRIGRLDPQNPGQYYTPDVYRHIEVSGLDDEMSMNQIREIVIGGSWPIWPLTEEWPDLDFIGSVFDDEITPEELV